MLPSATSHVVEHTSSRNQRSWVTTTSPPARARTYSASQATPSTSRWLVGSSRTRRSSGRISCAASATRRRSPPDMGATGASSPSRSSSRPVSTERTAGSPAHSCSAANIDDGRTTSRTVAPGGSVPDWSSAPRARSPRRVTRPESGSSAPVISDRRVDLPPPLRPTTPIRSPAATPSETSSRMTVVPWALCTRSRLTRLRGALIAPSIPGPLTGTCAEPVTGWNGHPSGTRAEPVTGWNGHPSGTRAERARRGGKGGASSGQAGDLDRERVPLTLRAGEQALERGDVAVVTPPAEGDVAVADVDGVRRIEGIPPAVPPLHPGVAFPRHRLADPGVRLRVQVAGDVARGQAEGPQQPDGDVGDVLADALALGPCLHRVGLHVRRPGEVLHVVADEPADQRPRLVRMGVTHRRASLGHHVVVHGRERRRGEQLAELRTPLADPQAAPADAVVAGEVGPGLHD